MEIVTDDRLVQKPRIEEVPYQIPPQCASYHVTTWISRHLESRRCRASSIDAGRIVYGVIEHHRRRGRNVQQNVVERRIVGNRKTTADHTGVVSTEHQPGQPAFAPVRGVSKTNT